MGGTKEVSKKHSEPAAERAGFTFGFTHEDLPDGLQLLSLLCGTMAIILKYRFCAWLSLINAVICLANMRTIEIDIKSIMSSLGIAIMSLIFAYANTCLTLYVPIFFKIGPTSNQFV